MPKPKTDPENELHAILVRNFTEEEKGMIMEAAGEGTVQEFCRKAILLAVEKRKPVKRKPRKAVVYGVLPGVRNFRTA